MNKNYSESFQNKLQTESFQKAVTGFVKILQNSFKKFFKCSVAESKSFNQKNIYKRHWTIKIHHLLNLKTDPAASKKASKRLRINFDFEPSGV